jgi:pyridoxamine 5'-phosphate oxidase
MNDTASMKHPTQLTSGDFTAAEEPFGLPTACLMSGWC